MDTPITKRAVLAPAPEPAPQCDHDWPTDANGQNDMDGACTKCGMSFQFYIHVECP